MNRSGDMGAENLISMSCSFPLPACAVIGYRLTSSAQRSTTDSARTFMMSSPGSTATGTAPGPPLILLCQTGARALLLGTQGCKVPSGRYLKFLGDTKSPPRPPQKM